MSLFSKYIWKSYRAQKRRSQPDKYRAVIMYNQRASRPQKGKLPQRSSSPRKIASWRSYYRWILFRHHILLLALIALFVAAIPLCFAWRPQPHVQPSKAFLQFQEDRQQMAYEIGYHDTMISSSEERYFNGDYIGSANSAVKAINEMRQSSNAWALLRNSQVRLCMDQCLDCPDAIQYLETIEDPNVGILKRDLICDYLKRKYAWALKHNKARRSLKKG